MENLFISSEKYTQHEIPMPRCLILFDNAIKSPVTKRSYMFNLKQFLSFATKQPEDLLLLKDSDIQILLENYLFYLKEKVSPNSIKTKLAPVALFLSMNDRTHPDYVMVVSAREPVDDLVTEMKTYSKDVGNPNLVIFIPPMDLVKFLKWRKII